MGVLRTAAAGVPRIDHDPATGECLGLLVEEQRTNLLAYSEQFDNAAWGKNNTSVTANTVTAPDGETTVDKLVEGSISNSFFIVQSVSFTSGNSYSLSVFAKEDPTSAKRYLTLMFPSAAMGSNVRSTFDLSAGTYTEVNSPDSTDMVNVGGGWWRCSITATATATTSESTSIRLFNAATDTLASYTGDGTSGLYIWGAQLEVGALPTSYIPTTTAAVTRNADIVSMTGTDFSDWYNANEGTLYANANRISPVDISFTPMSIGSDLSNFLAIQNTSATSQWITRARAAGDNPFAITASLGTDTPAKIAFGVSTTEYTTSINGAAVTTFNPTGTPVFPTADSLKIGTPHTGAITGAGHIKQLQYYPRRLTNTQLQALSA
jgi:hypothetical protein